MDKAGDEQPPVSFLASKFHDLNVCPCYYPFGNTPAEDFLHSVIDEKEPSVLVLGCGDMRSCFYTLWKNFSGYATKTTGSHFCGVHFVLNDLSAAVLARNILLLHLALSKPPRKGGMRRLISAIWGIWFNHQLLPDHSRMLKEALGILISMSENEHAWSQENNVLRNIVKFGSFQTLHSIHQFWQMWLNDDFGSVKNLIQNRQLLMEKRNEIVSKKEAYALNEVMDYKDTSPCFSTDKILASDKLFAMKEEVIPYVMEGSVFAEEVLGRSFTTDETVVNPTFFEMQDHSYTMHYDIMPYSCFFHGAEISEKAGINKDALSSVVTVEQNAFDHKCLLANSVQQLALWVQGVREVLKPVLHEPKPCFTFDLHCCDALQFCQIAQLKGLPPGSNKGAALESYDVINSSNLLDYIAPAAVITLLVPLLKEKGILFTTTFFYKPVAERIEQYLGTVFGFEPEMLPILCGVSCTGQEGRYADFTAVKPSPWRYESQRTQLNKTLRCIKLLVWQKTSGLPLMIPSLANTSPITKALVQCTQSACKSWAQSHGGHGGQYFLCTETAVQVFLAFIRQLHITVPITDHHFWEGLVTCIKEDPDMRPFQIQLQTQALLHQIHMHIMLSSSDCPLCNGKTITSSLAKHRVLFEPKYTNVGTPTFPAFIHKDRNLEFISSLNTHGLKALRKFDIHVIDSCWCTNVENKIKMEFFFPRHFAQEGYNLTVTCSLVPTRKGAAPFLTGISTFKLADVVVEDAGYICDSPCMSSSSTCSHFGRVVQHTGDGDAFQSDIALSEQVLDQLRNPQVSVKTQSLSDRSLELVCAENKLTLSYPYPVRYDSIQTRLSRKQGILHVQSCRAMNFFWSRPPLFAACPSNQICFQPVPMLPTFESCIDRMQYPKDGVAVVVLMKDDPSRVPIDFTIKGVITKLLETPCTGKLLQLQSQETNEVICVIMFNSGLLYDIENMSPAVDIYYHFTNQDSKQLVFPGWTRLGKEVSSGKRMAYFVAQKVVPRLQSIFECFSARTRNNPSARSSLLRKHEISQHFSRAVIYPLYWDWDEPFRDVDVQSDDIGQSQQHFSARQPKGDGSSMVTSGASRSTTAPLPQASAATVQHCDHCHTQSSHLKKCTRCKKAAYCNEDCQCSDWEQHRLVCQPASQLPPQPALDKCEGCEKANKPLRKCSCRLAAYCSKECQRNDWPRHFATCKSAKGHR